MRPLQDKCEPTSFEDIEGLFVTDVGMPLEDLFAEFDAEPIGVASLAQVHRGRLKETGQEVCGEGQICELCVMHALKHWCSCNIHTSWSSVTSIWRWWKSPSVRHKARLSDRG